MTLTRSDRRRSTSHWAVVLPEDRYVAEKLFHHDTLALTGGTLEVAGDALGLAGCGGLAQGDDVLLVAGDQVVALARVRGADPLVVEYTHRIFDAPQPAGHLAIDGPVTKLDPAAYQAVADRIGPRSRPRTWLVSLDLPIEAEAPAEAVRRFWTYAMELGPGELPVFVWPPGDELAMQAYVLGEVTDLDPDEDDEG